MKISNNSVYPCVMFACGVSVRIATHLNQIKSVRVFKSWCYFWHFLLRETLVNH